MQMSRWDLLIQELYPHFILGILKAFSFNSYHTLATDYSLQKFRTTQEKQMSRKLWYFQPDMNEREKDR
jgi:hypothetical protein